jgi:hypothetical protein
VHGVGNRRARRTERNFAIGERALRVSRAFPLPAFAKAFGRKVVEH